MMNMENWIWAQYAYWVLTLIGLLIAANTHGKTVVEKKSFWNGLLSTVIVSAILYYGGFFK